MGAEIGVLQFQKIIDQFLNFRSGKLLISLYGRLAGHRRNLFHYHVRRISFRNTSQLINELQKQRLPIQAI